MATTTATCLLFAVLLLLLLLLLPSLSQTSVVVDSLSSLLLRAQCQAGGSGVGGSNAGEILSEGAVSHP